LNQPFLSIVIPIYNEEKRLPNAMEQVFAFVDQQPYQSEIILVENGSSDRTLEIAQGYAAQHERVHIFQESLRGKGGAVRRGMLEAHGQFRFICDSDFSMPAAKINRFLPPACDCDVAIASREAPGAIRYNEPEYRHFTGRVFNFLIRLLALPGLHDTQCGFKCFRAEAAEAIFPYQTLNGWAFDVEVLFIARRLGYQIIEIPIPWYFNADSRISVLRDSGRMLIDLLTIRMNALRGLYGPKA
jgi:dolichyl-phosphate beta-glucosyltransferase